MKRLVIVLACLAFHQALASDRGPQPSGRTQTAADSAAQSGTGSAEAGAPAASNPMAAWKPPKLTREAEDKQEIAALFQKLEQAGRQGDLDAAAALIDFPVLMATDNSKGQPYASAWSREQWTQAMKPFYEKPMHERIAHHPTITVLSDTLANAVDRATFSMGGKTVTTRSSSLLVRKDGQWKIKSMVEGGWGDAMQSKAGEQAGSPDAGTGSSGAQQQKQ